MIANAHNPAVSSILKRKLEDSNFNAGGLLLAALLHALNAMAMLKRL